MKLLSLLLLASAVIAVPAQAEIVTYRYSGTVNMLWEYDKASDTITDVQSSSMPGWQFRIGDTFTGTFSYDTSMALSEPRYQPPAPAQGSYNNYDGYVRADLTDVQGGLVYQSDPTWTFLAASVADSASSLSGSDILSLSTTGPWSPSRFELVGFFFDDLTGTALNSSALPATIGPALFKYSSVTYGFVANNGDQMNAMASLQSLERLDTQGLPEPGSLALLGSGMAGLFGFRRRARRALTELAEGVIEMGVRTVPAAHQWQRQALPCRYGTRPWSKT